ncbi:hypothetical protein [Pectobacterium parmentieri]|uniref:Uncharacterized protein n=1 Tax=Pectobacterium parmentieri TaxID=1905730 RepID=A0A8B3F7N7_PECPM|nr:hypothetical protein [Pectobacterium parmentieri]AOR58549.1 hypothetical protein A8F97_06465 [Pectobacterium parmentieri]AYH10449.1 hypothetical protein C5E24_12535 [Pectobacterium parmentieri]AYH18840.1 hypothetical protein C5E22_10255 [Pectobacterium parmentieri]AYH36731.1 hypothetical protein C5E17_12280 [Pectobacterium parmentieri]AZS56962.1 hypothetical protein C5E18_12970 [Pectobacterium parmentieri]
MKWVGFTLFIGFTLIYIWNGTDLFEKKEWRAFGIKFIAVLLGAFFLVFFLVGISKFIPLITKETARTLTVIIPASFVTVLLSKFFVIMLNTIFDIIIRFHERYNTAENYSKLSSLFNKYGPRLRMLAKCLASFGCILMFYGIWFGSTV